jgi:hypothetical protein
MEIPFLIVFIEDLDQLLKRFTVLVGGLESRENGRTQVWNFPCRVHDPTIAIKDLKMLHKDYK